MIGAAPPRTTTRMKASRAAGRKASDAGPTGGRSSASGSRVASIVESAASDSADAIESGRVASSPEDALSVASSTEEGPASRASSGAAGAGRSPERITSTYPIPVDAQCLTTGRTSGAVCGANQPPPAAAASASTKATLRQRRGGGGGGWYFGTRSDRVEVSVALGRLPASDSTNAVTLPNR